MQVRILKPVAGYGTFVHGSPRLFSLLPGDVAEVEDGQARQWIAGGIASAMSAEEAPRETATLPQPENAVLQRPSAANKPRPKKGAK